MSVERLAGATGIDTACSIRFTFDGRALSGYDGDTLASALLANGIDVVGRSFKRHRPRGLLAAGLEECNALVTVGEGARQQVNLRATEVRLRDGLVARSQNAWPNIRLDVGAINDLLSAILPAGFYHKTFKWPHWHWFEWAVRRAAGLGRAGAAPDPDRYGKRFAHTDVLVIGAGPTGLHAALAAAQRGADVMLLDTNPQVGGSLCWRGAPVAGQPAGHYLSELQARLQQSNIRVLCNTTALGAYDDNLITAVEHCDNGVLAQRLWKIRAQQVVLASGAYERPLVFPHNDRPGVRLLDAAERFANQYGVAARGDSVVVTNNDDAWRRALVLQQRGVAVVAIVDVRSHVAPELVAQARAQCIATYPGYAVVGTVGRRALRRVDIAQLDATGRGFAGAGVTRLAAAQLLMSGGWNPVVHLYSQAGGRLRFDTQAHCFVPDAEVAGMVVAGAANGQFDLGHCIAGGQAAGHGERPVFETAKERNELTPFWQTPMWRGRDRRNVQWVDFLHDVTVADIELAAREGFRSVEHLKRYTATGMAVDQGKTSNVNALAVMAQISARDIAAVGTTRFRPPFHPVSIGALAGDNVGELAHRYRQLPVQWHAENGAVFEDHSGWMRPAYYRCNGIDESAAILAEVAAARHDVALFDSSSLGKIEVHGADAAEFLNRLYINNVKTLKPGRLRYGMMLNENGIIIDDGVFACLAPDHYLVTTSSAGALDIPFWMEEWLQTEWSTLDVQVTPVTAQWATLTLSGPKARGVLAQLGLDVDLDADTFPHMTLREASLGDIALRICRVSFTGEISYEINVSAGYADALWRRLMRLGASHGIRALGMEALDVLRVEKGYLEVGVDTDGDTTPLDVGWTVPISKKQHDFLGRRSLQRPHNLSSGRHQLAGFVASATHGDIPVGSHLLSADGAVLGHITSSTASPTLSKTVGMALVRGANARMGTVVVADIDGRRLPVTLVAPAHYDAAGERLHG